MVASFYPEHVIARAPGGESAFWERVGLRDGDWVGLVSRLYSDIFDVWSDKLAFRCAGYAFDSSRFRNQPPHCQARLEWLMSWLGGRTPARPL